MLLIIYGLPFSGKRQFGRLLASHLSCNFISTSEIRNRWIAAPTFRLSEKRAVYLTLLQESAEALASGKCLVLSGTFYRKEFRKDFNELAATFNKRIIWIHFSAVRKPNEGYIGQIYDEAYAGDIRKKIEERFQPVKEGNVIHLDNKDTMDRALARIDKLITNDLSDQVSI